MSSIPDSDWERLNALADDALGREEARALQKRIDSDPALAAEFDRILMLKSSLRQLRPAVPEGTSDRTARRRASKRPLAVAAAIFLSLCIAVAASGALLGRNGVDTPVEIHKAFSDKTYILNSGGALTLSSGTGIGSLSAPDLTASNLTLVDVRTFRNDRGERVAMHYRGRRGCRVTLIADALSMPAESDLAGFDLVYRWTTSKTRFVLIADGMDAARFAAIGAFAEAASRLSDEQELRRLALVDRTAKAKPCA